jgi:sodium/potassium-transporting ATPase subunit alpha
VKEGTGKGIVVKIGDSTVLGQIANMASTSATPKSPLRIELDRFVIMITIIALVLGVLFFLAAWLIVKYDVMQCIIFGIGILVAKYCPFLIS